MIFEDQLIPYSLSEIPDGPYLVFAPHPDDETLGMGGTILLASDAGIDVSVVFVTNGDKGGDPGIRKLETERASSILGFKKIFYLDLLDREVADSQMPEKKLNDIIDDVQPLTLFLPAFQEIHPDHRAVTHKIISFLSSMKNFFDLWFYEINRQGEVNRLIDITPVLDRKKLAIDCYQSQLGQLDYKSHALCLNFSRSISVCGIAKYVEAFWHYNPKSGMSPETEYFQSIDKYRSYCPSSFSGGKELRLKFYNFLRKFMNFVKSSFKQNIRSHKK